MTSLVVRMGGIAIFSLNIQFDWANENALKHIVQKAYSIELTYLE
jgi:hypothetical protein